MPDVVDDDELLDQLPPMTHSDDEEEEGLSTDELGLELGEGGREQVGLDDSTGLDDPARLFDLELPPHEAIDDGDVDAIPIGDVIDASAEYGWTEDGASASDDRWDPADVDLPPLIPLGRDDTGGAEGIEEEFDLGGPDGDSLPHLPPLERGGIEGEDEPFDLELGFDTDLRPPGHRLPPLLEDARAERVLGAPTRDLVLHDGVIWAATEAGVYRGAERREGRGLEGTPVSVALQADAVVVGTSSGAFLSVDGAQTFSRVAGLGRDPVRVLADHAGTLWACGETGRLQRSEDRGASWSTPLLLTKVTAIAAPSEGVVTLSAPRAARPQVASSRDGGARWTASEAPALQRPAADARYALAACGDHVAVASPADDAGPYLSRDRGRTWRRVSGLLPAEALAMWEEEALVLYAAHAVGDRRVVARHVPDRDGGSATLLELEQGRVHRLVVSDGGELLVASDAGAWRIRFGGSR